MSPSQLPSSSSSNAFALFQAPNYSPSSLNFASYASVYTSSVNIASANDVAIHGEADTPPRYSTIIDVDAVWVPTTSADLGCAPPSDESSMKNNGKSRFAKFFSRKRASSSSSPPPYIIDLDDAAMIEERVRAMDSYFGGAAF